MERIERLEATCPDCRGPLSETKENGDFHEYRCLVGHVYSARTLLQAHSETQERALWAAAVALKETAIIVEAVASQFPPEITERLRKQAAKKLEQAAAISKIIEDLQPFQTEE